MPLPRIVRRIEILRPLAIRDFALLWTGMTISLLGDGIYFVAIAWQVLTLSNRPTALSIVGAAYVTPQVLLLLLGGVLTDRLERRRLMMVGDVLRAAAIGAIGVLSIAGVLHLWEVVVLVAVFGIGDSLFAPAFTAIVPEIVPTEQLVQANSLDHFVNPATRLVGPALGGLLVAWIGPGTAFVVDALSFLASFAALAFMQTRRLPRLDEHKPSALRELREGFAFVRRKTWLWGTLATAAFGNYVTTATFVIVPYLVKNKLHGGAAQYGLIPACGAIGGLLMAVVIGQLGLPRRHVLAMYLGWGVGLLGLAGYGASTRLVEMLAIAFAMGAVMTIGNVVWGTLMHVLVPQQLMGRVSAFDWTLSIVLTPIGYATLGPLAVAFGPSRTLIVAGIAGALVHVLFLVALPRLREPERDERMLPGRPDSRLQES